MKTIFLAADAAARHVDAHHSVAHYDTTSSNIPVIAGGPMPITSGGRRVAQPAVGAKNVLPSTSGLAARPAQSAAAEHEERAAEAARPAAARFRPGRPLPELGAACSRVDVLRHHKKSSAGETP